MGVGATMIQLAKADEPAEPLAIETDDRVAEYKAREETAWREALRKAQCVSVPSLSPFTKEGYAASRVVVRRRSYGWGL